MQNIIQIYQCLLKLLHKQDTILKFVIFQPKTKIFPRNSCLKYFPVRTHPKQWLLQAICKKLFKSIHVY
jgi:hypothetical protein